MINGIPNRPLYFYQKDIIARMPWGLPVDCALLRKEGESFQSWALEVHEGRKAVTEMGRSPRVMSGDLGVSPQLWWLDALCYSCWMYGFTWIYMDLLGFTWIFANFCGFLEHFTDIFTINPTKSRLVKKNDSSGRDPVRPRDGLSKAHVWQEQGGWGAKTNGRLILWLLGLNISEFQDFFLPRKLGTEGDFAGELTFFSSLLDGSGMEFRPSSHEPIAAIALVSHDLLQRTVERRMSHRASHGVPQISPNQIIHRWILPEIDQNNQPFLGYLHGHGPPPLIDGNMLHGQDRNVFGHWAFPLAAGSAGCAELPSDRAAVHKSPLRSWRELGYEK